MLTRNVRTRLVVFAVISVAILTITSLFYIRLPQLLGFEQYDVTANFADATGLYENAIVTYRGAQVGRVDSVTLKPDHVQVVLQMDDGTHVPTDSIATVHSTSAIGEQYIDLVPTGAPSRDLHDGSTIPVSRTRGLGKTTDLIDNLDSLLRSIPKDALTRTLDDINLAFRNAGPDLQRLVVSASELLDSAHANFGPTKALLNDLGPFMRTQQDVSGETTSSVTNLASFSHQLVLSNAHIVSLLHEVPPASSQLVGLENDLTPTLNTLLANLVTTGQVLNVYVPAVRQVLTIYPALVAGLTAFAQVTASTGKIPLYFHLNLNDPPACVKGFIPIKDRRSPLDTSEASTPNGLHCKEAPNSIKSVRGARNYQCLNNPGVRAATPNACLGLPEPDGTSNSDTASSTTSTTSTPATAPYQPSTGKVLAPNGKFYLVGDVSSQQKGKPRWQDLLLRPIGK